jgi:hypothetical protein
MLVPRTSRYGFFLKELTMKNYLAVFIGTQESFERSGWNTLSEEQRKERERTGINAWKNWIEANKASIVDVGSPLGKTKKISAAGIEDFKNALTGYTVVRAESHQAAAQMFEGHPHFAFFPGDHIEVMECLPIPSA